VCWQDCLTGFVEHDQPVEWSAAEPGQFTAHFTVPDIPWLSADGPVPLEPGDYTVSVQCLGPNVEECALKEGQAGATFHLTGPASTRCGPEQPCAELHFSPDQAAPGAQVTLTGWAPVVETFGDQPSGYSLVIQVPGANSQTVQIGQIKQALNGKISGAFAVPLQLPGAGLLPPGPYDIALQAYISQY
jgi:hypothetical protein